MIKQIALSVIAVVATFSALPDASASDWSAGSAAWSSNGTPGWNGTGIPNGAGAIANFGTAAGSGTTTQDITTGVTVGTISYSQSSGNRVISSATGNTAAITLNNNGNGALITNTSATAGANNLQISSPLTLADNLLVSNTQASTNTSGAIQLSGAIGGTGNVTFNNAINNLSSVGSIRVAGSNNFAGSVTIQKGTVSFGTASSFGGVNNALTLGQSGQGSATLLGTNSGLTNNITVASGTGGTQTIARIGTGAAAYSGTLTLNGGVTLYSESTGSNTMSFSNAISGAGGITKTGTGQTTFSGGANNTYSGLATVNSGTLILNKTANVNAIAGDTRIVGDGTAAGTGTIQLSASNQFANTSAIELAGGTLNMNNVSEGTAASGGAGLGALTLSANSTIDFGTGTNSNILHFAGLGSHTFGGPDLAITNWSGVPNAGGSGDRLLFTGTRDDFIAQYSQSDVSFNGLSGYEAVQFGDFYEITAVPEPSTYAAGILAVGAMGWTQRRRFSALLKKRA